VWRCCTIWCQCSVTVLAYCFCLVPCFRAVMLISKEGNVVGRISVSVCQRVCFWADWPFTLICCMCMGHSSTQIEIQGLMSRHQCKWVCVSGVTSHRQPQQCRGGGPGPNTVKGAQSEPNYVSRLLSDCVPVFRKIITPAYLLYRSGLSIWTGIRGSKVDYGL